MMSSEGFAVLVATATFFAVYALGAIALGEIGRSELYLVLRAVGVRTPVPTERPT